MEFGDLSTIENVDFSDYRTCRGAANRAEFERVIDILLDPKSTEDELDYAVNDGLWDLFSHQNTLYSSTPLALYLILNRTTKSQRTENYDLARFIELCKQRGNEGIYLTGKELTENRSGSFPIFSISEIIRKYA